MNLETWFQVVGLGFVLLPPTLGLLIHLRNRPLRPDVLSLALLFVLAPPGFGLLIFAAVRVRRSRKLTSRKALVAA